MHRPRASQSMMPSHAMSSWSSRHFSELSCPMTVALPLSVTRVVFRLGAGNPRPCSITRRLSRGCQRNSLRTLSTSCLTRVGTPQ
jgi:hypothetical protein